jgi:hypothetical protein
VPAYRESSHLHQLLLLLLTLQLQREVGLASLLLLLLLAAWLGEVLHLLLRWLLPSAASAAWQQQLRPMPAACWSLPAQHAALHL